MLPRSLQLTAGTGQAAGRLQQPKGRLSECGHSKVSKTAGRAVASNTDLMQDAMQLQRNAEYSRPECCTHMAQYKRRQGAGVQTPALNLKPRPEPNAPLAAPSCAPLHVHRTRTFRSQEPAER